MFREIRYSLFIIIICLFIFFTGKYYFSDNNKKNSYRSLKTIDDKINIYSETLPVLKNNTKNIIEFIEEQNDNKKRKFNFWKLLEANE